MARVYKIYAEELGGDIQTVDIYHTSITASNLIQAAVTASVLTEGSGLEVQVPDAVTTFLAYVSSSEDLCYLKSGSLTVTPTVKGVRYFDVEAWGDGEVGSISIPSTPQTSSYSQAIDYRTPGNYMTIKATCVYPTVVEGFYYDTPPFTEENLISVGSGDPQEKFLTISTLDAYTGSKDDKIFVKFSTGTGDMSYYYSDYYNSYYNSNNNEQ